MTNREQYLSDPWASVDPDPDRVLPPWIQREAEVDEEKIFEGKLKVESLSHHFRTKYLEATTVKDRQAVLDWKPEAAATWLSSSVKGDMQLARQVMAEAGCVDEKATEVLMLMGEKEDGDKTEKLDTGSPTKVLMHENTPPRLADIEVEKHKELKKSARVGSYGLVLTEAACELYKAGVKIAEISVEDCGSYGILAEELGALTTEAEVETLFDVKSEEKEVVKIGWLKKSDILENPIFQRQDEQMADNGQFDPAAPIDMHPKVDNSAGPASLNSGSQAPVSPQVFDAQ